MASGDDTVRALREALNVSPDNLPLRRHLAETLLGLGRFEEAERELRDALSGAPEDLDLRLLVARAYFQQGKFSAATVVVEDLVKRPEHPAAAQVLYARLLLRAGDVPGAVAQYKLAMELDPESAEPDLAEQLASCRKKRPARCLKGGSGKAGKRPRPSRPPKWNAPGSRFATSAAWTR